MKNRPGSQTNARPGPAHVGLGLVPRDFQSVFFRGKKKRKPEGFLWLLRARLAASRGAAVALFASREGRLRNRP
jgi:hypothetical protein